MSLRKRSGWTRISIILSLLLLSLSLGAVASAQDQTGVSIYKLQAVFNVAEPPEAPYHAHQSMLIFQPGAEAALHRHGGPGYITILEGELTLYEDDVMNVYQAGDSFVETSDKLYKGGNYTDEDTVLMVTYLVPAGDDMTTTADDPEAPEPPELTPQPLAETTYEFTDPPESFDLVHETKSYEPGQVTDTITAQGATLLTPAAGNLDITVDGETTTIPPGDAAFVEQGQEYSLHNTGTSAAVTMSTEIVPDVHSVAPAAGSATVDRTFVMWLVVMTGSALLVVGGVLRLTSVRMR